MKSHFTYSDRIKLQYNLDNNLFLSASLLAKILKKSRSSIYYEIKTNMTIKVAKDAFNGNLGFICEKLNKFPFVCNGCPNKRCSHRKREYNAFEAHEKARKSLVNSRVDTAHRRAMIKTLNIEISPLVKNGQSLYVAKETSKCPISESTMRRYVEKGLLDINRSDLPNASKFRVKKEYNYSSIPRIDINVLNGRTYQEFKEYLESNDDLKVIQLDSVIGKVNDKHAILTVYFVNSQLQLGFLYDRKHSNVVSILRSLDKIAKKYGYKLFDVVLADNGSEFRNLYKLEVDEDTGESICRVFYTDPYKSCQKAECKKNHGLFRRIMPKGNSFDLLNQENVDLMFSHINSYPRSSLDGKTPYELFSAEYNSIILTEINILQIDKKDVKLK